jgi:hypothetical protein
MNESKFQALFISAAIVLKKIVVMRALGPLRNSVATGRENEGKNILTLLRNTIRMCPRKIRVRKIVLLDVEKDKYCDINGMVIKISRLTTYRKNLELDQNKPILGRSFLRSKKLSKLDRKSRFYKPKKRHFNGNKFKFSFAFCFFGTKNHILIK